MIGILLFLLALNSAPLSADDSTRAAHWGFGSEDATPLHLHGDLQRDQAGPRPPEFPDFPDDNTAYRFAGKGYVSAEDPGEGSPFDFENGDAITLEAWVNVRGGRPGELMYVVAKGRSDSPQYARDNQNWALRVVRQDGETRLSFLFATKPGGSKSHWHRWTSEHGFGAETGWHHIAVGYRFGDPKSIIGWIDGSPTLGAWDMGGATTDPPVVDNDSVWIGSSRGGSSSNGFKGLIDEVAIHRERLDDETIARRFNRLGGPVKSGPQQEVMPPFTSLPSGRALLTVGEGLPHHTRWLNEGESWPEVQHQLALDAFLLHRMPVRFDEWGIRTGWKSPVLIRMAADVQWPTGAHRLMIRGRGLGRLWVDGTVIARTDAKFRKRTNLEEIEPVAAPPVAGARRRQFSQQEMIEPISVLGDDGAHVTGRVVWEMIIGGTGMRTETTELCVAVQYHGQGAFHVLTPRPTNHSNLKFGSEQWKLTDAVIEPAIARTEKMLVADEDSRRRAASSSMDAYWQRRHEHARDSAVMSADPSRPQSVDAWISRKIDVARQNMLQVDKRATERFHGQVLPLLREKCFRCHGEKEKGGLRLHTRDHALKSGETGLPAIIPGNPDDSELMSRVRGGDMPPTDETLADDEIALLDDWIRDGADWPAPPVSPESVAHVELIDDASFLRRVYIDTLGIPPSEAEARAFLADPSQDKRDRLVDRLLKDERIADHWVSFWMDLLAENPTLLNASLNSTGPFRWYLYDALRDGKPLDRMVTELIVMRGTTHDGGSAGFGLAGENDAPMAEKAHILASSFLGIELQCARCHDAPYHQSTQRDLFSLAAMLQRKPLTPPKSSRVPDEFFAQQQREALIRVTLPMGTAVRPRWPFGDVTGSVDDASINEIMLDPADTRERLAALITAPQNRRFARVMVNHLWKRLIGAGIVEPVHDWEGRDASHPEMLDWLASHLIAGDYDARQILALIMKSDAYQRQAVGENLQAPPQLRFFNAPDRRRLTAEQIVDSLFTASDSKMEVEELTFVHDGVHPINTRLTLGKPRRAWMFASLNNERDRPSLSMPRAQPIADVLQAFGWTGSRQKPIAERDQQPNVLQPGILANGTLTLALTRAFRGSGLAELAISRASPEELVDSLFLRYLVRLPSDWEREFFASALNPGFASRVIDHEVMGVKEEEPLPQVTWTNHLVPEANEIQLKIQKRVLDGPVPDPRLSDDWREVLEDVTWSLVNHTEFVWVP